MHQLHASASDISQWHHGTMQCMHRPVICMHQPVMSQADACTYCMGSKVSSLFWIYLYSSYFETFNSSSSRLKKIDRDTNTLAYFVRVTEKWSLMRLPPAVLGEAGPRSSTASPWWTCGCSPDPNPWQMRAWEKRFWSIRIKRFRVQTYVTIRWVEHFTESTIWVVLMFVCDSWIIPLFYG